MIRKTLLLGAAFALIAGQANAVGCLSGAVVGGVAGHVAGHHALAGAAAGCIVGHEIAVHNKKKKQAAERARAAQAAQGSSTMAPAPAH